MKTSRQPNLTAVVPWTLRSVRCQVLLLALAVAQVAAGAATGKTFATPEAAVSALGAAASAGDSDALHAVFGPGAADLENPDRVQATNEIRGFASAFNQTHRIVRESDSRYILEVGADSWPFPVPIVKQDDRWCFDTEAGKDELVSRRIGRNELSALEVVRAYVEAQREYASRDRDGDEVLEYAQRIESSAGTKDGLYWSPDLDGEVSPFGPLIAQAQRLGYQTKREDPSATTEPFRGYFFKVLTHQAKSAPGGKYHYLVNGNMIGGFAIVAWPAEYGESGIMTFIVNQQGLVYQKDLGVRTARIAAAMKDYDPDKTWTISRD